MIKVTDRFYINANSNNYVLQEKTTIKDEQSEKYGQEVFKDLGYYASLENCLQGILKATTREYIARNEVNSIQDLIKQIRSINEYLQSLNLKV